MMSARESAAATAVIDPPGPSAPTPAAGCAEALFQEARRRRRRRRLAVLGAILVLAAVTIGFGLTRAPRLPGPGGARTGQAGNRPGAGVAPGTSVAWVDYNGRLHVGSLTAGTQRVVATINADPATPLTQAGGRIYWLDQPRAYGSHPGKAVVREADLATGRITEVGPGQSVFPAGDARHVFISRSDTSFDEVPATGTAARHSHRLRLPPGWFAPFAQGSGAGKGILVQSADRRTVTRDHILGTVGVWNPGSGRVRVLGRNDQVIAASPPVTGGSLLAWLPLRCAPGQDCPLRITGTQPLSTRTVRSPLRHGFADGGAFSPDGRRLAVFANLTGDPHTAQLALVDTRTGTLRLVPGARTGMGAPMIWAQWLPDGRHLIAGGIDSGYLVNASARTARQLAFIKGPAHDGEDVDYSTVVVPPRQ